jgi:Raf kinase inhibitor-like YbhB/YbcL family protein
MNYRPWLVILAISAIILSVVFLNQKTPDKTMGNLILKSSAFKEGETIPAKNTCDGDNVNPLLEIRNIPENAKSLALIVDDPDATGGVVWVHWLVWNIEPKTQYVSEDNIPFGAVQGTTSFNKQKYSGPCPPRGNAPHRYMFKAYALDIVLDLPAGSSKSDLEKAMGGHILDETVLMGRYGRKQ